MAKRNKWTYNFANNPKVRARLKAYFPNKIQEVRTQRRELEEEWLRFYNMWDVQFDDNHLYEGRARLYIPQVRKDIESQARAMTENAFPGENFLDVVPGSSGTKKGAIIQKNVRKWQVQQAGLRTKYHVYARQCAMLGTSPVYVPWRRTSERVFRTMLERGQKKPRVRRMEEEIFNGPDFMVRDLFKWYVFNYKKEDILEDGCFENMLASENDLLQLQAQGDLVNGKKVLEGKSETSLMDELTKDVERAENMGLTIGQGGFAGVATIKEEYEDGGTQDRTYLRTIIYTKIHLPEALEDGEPNEPIPVYMEIINNTHITVCKRNPFFHQKPPYVVGKYFMPPPDQFYGSGIPKSTQYMQYEINSKAEQAMDSATLSLNPVAVVDPGLAGQQNDFLMEPGAIWFANPQGVKFANLPDVSDVGYRAIGLLKSQMQEFSDRAPALPPQLEGKSRTATQSNIIAKAAQIDSKTFQVQNEVLVLEPLMEMWESLTDQHITEDQVIMILGNQSREWRRALVSKGESLGRYRYFWKSSSSIMDKGVLGRSIIDMLKTSTLIPPEQRVGLNINYPDILKMLWSEAWQLPDADRLFGSRDQEATDPRLEHKMLGLGMELEVLPGDDDPDHLAQHRKELEGLKNKQDQETLSAHMEKHRAQAEQKIIALRNLIAKQDRAFQEAAQQRQGGQGGGGAATRGNRTQLSPNATGGNVGSGVR